MGVTSDPTPAITGIAIRGTGPNRGAKSAPSSSLSSLRGIIVTTVGLGWETQRVDGNIIKTKRRRRSTAKRKGHATQPDIHFRYLSCRLPIHCCSFVVSQYNSLYDCCHVPKYCWRVVCWQSVYLPNSIFVVHTIRTHCFILAFAAFKSKVKAHANTNSTSIYFDNHKTATRAAFHNLPRPECISS